MCSIWAEASQKITIEKAMHNWVTAAEFKKEAYFVFAKVASFHQGKEEAGPPESWE